MNPDASIFVAGHRGLVGSALVRRLRAAGFENLLIRERSDLDLTDQGAVAGFFARERPQYVLLAAARVGGILANSTYPADFLRVRSAPSETTVDNPNYRCEYRLLIEGQNRMFLVPGGAWSASDTTLIVPLDGSVRVQFQFQEQPP